MSLDLDAVCARLDAATPGPWEAGSIWLRAGVLWDAAGRRYKPGDPLAVQCAHCHHGDPVLVDSRIDINGTRMLGHLHRDLDPYDPGHYISGPNGVVVLIGSTDGGPVIDEADAAFIRHARTDVGELVDDVERLTAVAVALAAFAMGGHDLENMSGCHGTPGVDCSKWCPACKVLADLPPALLDAARVLRLAAEIASYG